MSGFVHNDIFSFPNHSIQPLQNTVTIDFSESYPNFIVKAGTVEHNPVAGQRGGCYSNDRGISWNYFENNIGTGIYQ